MSSNQGEIWTVGFTGIYWEFEYQEKGGEQSSSFAKCEIPIREEEIRTVGLRGFWIVDQANEPRKFEFQEDEQVGFVKHEIMKSSKYWPTVIAKGHIGEGK
jgi:hypothetical protein